MASSMFDDEEQYSIWPAGREVTADPRSLRTKLDPQR
jgi:uncharacterized protein YbdZ (MbtH family)